MHHMSNTRHTPVIAELTELANKHTGLKVIYEHTVPSYEEMAEMEGSYDNVKNYSPDASYGSLWNNSPSGVDLKPWWTEFDRLRAIITSPLNEPILKDDHPVYQGLLYVANGKPTMFIDGMNMTVGRWKALQIKDVKPVLEVRRCDMVGRQLRLPAKDVDDTSMMDTWGTKSQNEKKKYRRPRPSNKIKKVK